MTTPRPRDAGWPAGADSRMSMQVDATADPAPSGRGAAHLPPHEETRGPLPRERWIGWRVRALALWVLVVCVSILAWAHWRASTPSITGHWRLDAQGGVTLAQAIDPALRALEGDVLLGFDTGSRRTDGQDLAALLHRSPRWIVSDAQRTQHHAMQAALDAALEGGSVRMRFARAGEVDVPVGMPGLVHLGVLFWLLSIMAGLLAVMAAVVVLARPALSNLPYVALAVGQAGVLALVAMASVPTLGIGHELAHWDAALRPAFDLASAAALALSACHFPTRLPHAGGLSLALAGLALAGLALLGLDTIANGWWWTQALCAGFAAVLLVLLRRSRQLRPHPLAAALLRFSVFAFAGWILITVATAATASRGAIGQNVAIVSSVAWAVFAGSMILLTPFLSRSQYLMREFALVAGVSSAATALDLLFVSAFSIGEFASLTLALFFALALYGPARQWLVGRLRRDVAGSMEQVFEHLYRVAREVQRHPQSLEDALLRLFRDLFRPLECAGVDRAARTPWAVADGSTLYVPIPELADPQAPSRRAVMLRFAHQGNRLFTSDDARLADRVIDQLRHMVTYDLAVERGRTEERNRIAQDLHDDIGARLLTLIYQSPTAEMEEYVRHTLQDLKTLTRGLAAGEQLLTHAAAEWKSDMAHRLELAGCELDWVSSIDHDLELNVVQWSALTRVLRELVNNTITHARATRVLVELTLSQGLLTLSVRDNGVGRRPETWSHGLGLGGVRKRVKQLGGSVQWTESEPSGIRCRVQVPLTVQGPEITQTGPAG